jgi:DNA-binding NtrC family response regulator
MSQERILVVDDDANIRNGLKRTLEPLGYEVLTAENGFSALKILEDGRLHLAFVDLKMGGMDGRELFTRVHERLPHLPVIIITAYATIEDAIHLIKEGAYDYVSKPFDVDKVLIKISAALEKGRLVEQVDQLRHEVTEKYGFSNIVGRNHAMRKIYELVERVAYADAPVLITGETGTGKDLLAKAIHFHGARRDKPFIKVDCASLAPTLLESELFGHERGAFTGAVAQKTGRFEMADGGTVFLDEISNMELSLQVKLLRVLQDNEFERVGGTKTIKVNIRLISATNADLEKLVEAKKFRKDLYYRLKGVSLHVPALRERRDDIPLLATHFFRHFKDKTKSKAEGISPEALEKLLKYSWPGNVRELENCIEQAVVISRHRQITTADIPLPISRVELDKTGKSLDETLAEMEYRMICEALQKAGGNIESTAKILKTNRTTLYSKLKKLGISPQTFLKSN